jgi:K+-sensing histidine kinase KdpD
MHITHLISRNSVKAVAEKLRAARLLDAAMGAAISGLAAVGATMVAEGHPWKDIVPLVFTVVLLVVAALFGVRAGVIGTVLAALVFAAFLLTPTGSLNVANDSARNNLGWMLLIGLVFSFLFAPPTSGLRRQ